MERQTHESILEHEKMMDITTENFEAEVIAASVTTPVLVDFWAPWCGPCKTLGPLLEALETEYAGRFILAKVDTDAQPQLAQAFGIRSVPTVFIIKDGQPVDGFAGALPKGEIKAFLDKHLPSESEVEAQENKKEAAELVESGDSQAALAKLEEALATDPSDEKTRAQYVELLLLNSRFEEALQAWQPLAPLLTAGGTLSARPAALKVWLDAVAASPQGGKVEKWQAEIEKNTLNYEARFALAQHWLVAGERTQALDELLEIIMRDKTWNDGAARKAYIGILELLTPQKPASAPKVKKETTIELERQVHQLDPQQQLVAHYRRQLSMVLN